MIFDHTSGRLSDLDRAVVQTVPPGGNWRDLPDDFASNRIRQIRNSASRGEGSRSTYYGRLRWDRPAYTISTYFSRPGNGCFIHPEAPRLISIREAARLQSFPDSFRFIGRGRSRFILVGNAVPPLLAFQVASLFPTGNVIDLFAGAGGLSLGFEWAGHKVIAAVDNDPAAIETLKQSAKHNAIRADLSDPSAHSQLMKQLRLLAGTEGVGTLVGGPPCQGFSTAGHCRMDDPRNGLLFSFLGAVESLRPANVLIENVPALQWSRRRSALEQIMRSLNEMGYATARMIAHAEAYGVPQLRRRLFVLGSRGEVPNWPMPWCQIVAPAQLRYQPGLDESHERATPFSVADAIGDLPASTTNDPDQPVRYASSACSRFQQWARGEIGLLNLVPSTKPAARQAGLFEIELAS